MDKNMTFNELHNQSTPLLICNVWDVPSAQVAESLGYKAIGTSSAAIATHLGYSDGESMSFQDLYQVVSRVLANTTLPLTVDIEAGYSRNFSEVYGYIQSLLDMGVVGINIEDSIVEEERKLVEASEFSKLIVYLKDRLKQDGRELFINVRTDTFLLSLPDTLEETEKRIKVYDEAGADGIFVPCITKEWEIQALVKKTNLPINVMCMPDLPDFNKLKDLGVKRISMGNCLFDKIISNLEINLSSIQNNQSFESVF